LAVYRRPSRTRNVIAVLVLAALTLVTIDARSQGVGVMSDARGKITDAFAPLQRATHAALRPLGDFLTGALDYGSLKKENQSLRRQLAQAQTAQAQAAAEQQQAGQVLKNAGLAVPDSIPVLAVQIIDIGPSNFDNTVTIDRGTAEGVAAGQPVVAADGLVGTVQSASSHVSTVELVTDPSFDVGLALQGGNIGFATGTGRSLPLRVTIISTNLKPPVEKVGAVLSTSGLNGEKFPKGIPIGKVSKIGVDPGATEPVIQITPLVDPAQLSYLEVLLWFPPTATAP
jgi:rod shape-determining protein MreC